MNRNWREYNGKLVKREDSYLSMDFIEHWNEELREMSKNKRGSPFAFPKSFIEYAAFVKTSFNLTYRKYRVF